VAAGIVAVSLVLSGVLTWVLVRNLVIENSKDQLAGKVLLLRQQVVLQARGSRTQAEFVNNVSGYVSAVPLESDRVILLDTETPPVVIFDTEGQLSPGTPVQLGARRLVGGEPVLIGNASLGGTPYVVAAARLGTARVGWLVLARPKSVITAQATQELIGPLLIAGGISLAIALVLALLVSRAMTRPLTELAAASEAIASGDYARRVDFSGSDEIGVVGRAFNRMAENVERARQLQRDFLANVSHELKTPLTSLIGFSQALVDGSLATEQDKKRAATIIHEESERVLRMAQELLDLARVESGHISLHPQPIDVVAILEQEVDLVRPRARDRELAISIAASPALPPALADPERVHQVLDNLLDNAVKYAPPGTAISIAAQPAAPGQVEVQVANPAGDHRPDPERMFDRFYRADPSRSAAGGVGLGLAISRQLAQAMNGRLWADFDDQGWLRVRLVLPAEGSPRPEADAVRSTMRLAPRAVPPAG
jgi:signal transduction histidine kinase